MLASQAPPPNSADRHMGDDGGERERVLVASSGVLADVHYNNCKGILRMHVYEIAFLTKICHTTSLMVSNRQNRMLHPIYPSLPLSHLFGGVNSTSMFVSIHMSEGARARE